MKTEELISDRIAFLQKILKAQFDLLGDLNRSHVLETTKELSVLRWVLADEK